MRRKRPLRHPVDKCSPLLPLFTQSARKVYVPSAEAWLDSLDPIIFDLLGAAAYRNQFWSDESLAANLLKNRLKQFLMRGVL